MVRIVSAAALLVPTVLGAVLLAGSAVAPQSSGAGMSTDQRPVGYVLLALVAGAGWVIGTSGIFIMFRSPSALPGKAREYAIEITYRRQVAAPTDRPVVVGGRNALPMGQLAAHALLTGPMMTFLPPLLTGFLLHPGLYWPIEWVAVVAMAIVVVAWTLFLIQLGARTRHRFYPPPSAG